jgi:Zn-dependent protease with chaperone function
MWLRIFFGISLFAWLTSTLGQVILLRLLSTPLYALREAKIGLYTREELYTTITEVFKNSLEDEKPNIYVLKLDVANALALNVYLLNFIKPLNALYVTRKCLECLEQQELKAILYHEMGHFNGYMYTGSRTVKFSLFFVLFMPFAFAVAFKGLYAFLYVLGVLVFLFILAKLVLGSIDKRNHAIEHLSDLYAADKIGALAIVNSLIALGRANEPTNDKKQKDELKAKIVLPARKLIQWSSFDTDVVNGKIEPAEYDNFIKMIENTSNPRILGKAAIDDESSTHPSLTNRVMFIHRNSKQ